MANLTDGFIPARIAYQLGTKAMCNRLITAGLFEEAPDGYQFHDWFDKQLTKAEVESRRKFERVRKADQRKRHLVPVGQADMSLGRARALPNPTQPVVVGLGSNSPVGRATPSGAALNGGGAEAISRENCPLGCHEREGYRENGTVCDHIDHLAETKNGRKITQEVLAQIRIRQSERKHESTCADSEKELQRA